MTDQELKRISRFKITSIESFDDPSVNWPGVQEWRKELLEFIQDLEVSEAHREEDEVRVAEAKQQEKEQERERKERERERKAQDKKEERERKAQEKKRKREQDAQEKQAKKRKSTHPAQTDGSFFHPTPPSVPSQPIASSSIASMSYSTSNPPAPTTPHTPAPAQPIATQRAFIGANGQLLTLQTSSLPAYNPYPSPATPTFSASPNIGLSHTQAHSRLSPLTPTTPTMHIAPLPPQSRD
jgi:superfamily II DNA/RNA helicase